jgi:uncharacterized protein YcbK (DUF882 family)
MRVTAFFAMAFVLAASAVGAAPAEEAAPAREPRRRAVAPRALVTTSVARLRVEATAPRSTATWGEGLAAIEVFDRNSDTHTKLRLYHDDGLLDRDALRTFVRTTGPDRLDERLVRLVFRAAYHFDGARIEVVSATRKGTRGKHAHGEAIDFALTGVRAAELAAYLRKTPLAGVGIYTHPKTQYVHLDVRDRSFHWIDASPPGVTWRERPMADPRQAARDATYGPASDLPEAARPSL